MTTTTSSTVGATGQYPTLQAWFDAAPASLVTADVIWQARLQNQEFVSASTILTMASKTTDATRYFDITTDTGASFTDNASKATNALRYNAANGAAVRVTGDFAACIRIQVPYTRISKIQFSSTADTANAYPTIFADGAGTAGLVLDQIIAEGYARSPNGTSVAGVVNIAGTGSSISNSLIAQKSSVATAMIAGVSSNAQIHNCTLVSLGATLNVGLMTQYGPTTIKNTYIGGVTATDGSGNPSIVVNSATSTAAWAALASGSANNLTNVPLSTANFQNVTPGTHNLRKVSGSVLIDAGTGDPTYAATGILGTARPQGTAYDIGADEYVAPVADTTAPNLVSPTAAANGATAYTGSVSTDEAGGSLYYLVLPAATATPDVPTMVASGSTRAVSSTGTQPVSGSGLTQATAYRLHFMQKDTANNASTVVSSASFTTAALDTTAPTFPNGAVITPGTITSSSVAFSYPAASDTAPGVVAGYEINKGAGWVDNGTGSSGQFTGLASNTDIPVQVRAYDNANPKNYSAPLALTMHTAASPTGTFTTDACTSSGTLRANQNYVGTWFAGGVIGTTAGTPMQISGTLSAGATATVTATKGAGYVMLKFADGGVMYQEGTVA